MLLVWAYASSDYMWSQTVYEYIEVCTFDNSWNIKESVIKTSPTVRLVFSGSDVCYLYSFIVDGWSNHPSSFKLESKDNGWNAYSCYAFYPGISFTNWLYVKEDKSFIRWDCISNEGGTTSSDKRGYKLKGRKTVTNP